MNKVEAELRTAILQKDASKVGEICDYLRYDLGMTYQDQTKLVSRIGCQPDDFEELLYESDRSSV